MALILVIEDDANCRQMLCEMLGRNGHETMAASDGEAGLELCRSRQPDLAITDILMPKKDGIGTIMELNKEFPRVKIIAISGGGFIEGKEYLKAAKLLTKVKVALAKPFSKVELLGAVERLLKEPGGGRK